MYKISAAECSKIPNDYKGIFHDYCNKMPEYKGKKCAFESCFTGKPSTTLLIEGLHFEIIK